MNRICDFIGEMDPNVLGSIIGGFMSVLVAMITAYLVHRGNKKIERLKIVLQKEQKMHDQAVLAIVAIAYWIALGNELKTESEREKLHNLVWQATPWLPDHLAKKFHDMLAWQEDDIREVLYDIRTFIREYGNKSSRKRELFHCIKEVFCPSKKVFKKEDIVIFPPPKERRSEQTQKSQPAP